MAVIAHWLGARCGSRAFAAEPVPRNGGYRELCGPRAPSATTTAKGTFGRQATVRFAMRLRSIAAGLTAATALFIATLPIVVLRVGAMARMPVGALTVTLLAAVAVAALLSVVATVGLGVCAIAPLRR